MKPAPVFTITMEPFHPCEDGLEAVINLALSNTDETRQALRSIFVDRHDLGFGKKTYAFATNGKTLLACVVPDDVPLGVFSIGDVVFGDCPYGVEADETKVELFESEFADTFPKKGVLGLLKKEMKPRPFDFECDNVDIDYQLKAAIHGKGCICSFRQLQFLPFSTYWLVWVEGDCTIFKRPHGDLAIIMGIRDSRAEVDAILKDFLKEKGIST